MTLEAAEAVVHAVAGPAVALRGRDALGQELVLVLVGPQPELEIAWPPAVALPRDEELLDAVLAALNTSLASRYFRARTEPQRWCTKVAVKARPDEPALLRSWRPTCLEPGRCRTRLLLAHPEHLAWARERLGDPLGLLKEGARPWLAADAVARLHGRSEKEARKATSGDAGGWAIPVLGSAEGFAAAALRAANLKKGDELRAEGAAPGVHKYTTAARELVVTPARVTRLQQRAGGGSAPPERSPAAPPAPSEPTEAWARRKGLSQVSVRLHAGRGWAHGSPDAMLALVRAGWRHASVQLPDGKRVKGAFAATEQAAAAAAAAFSPAAGWKVLQ